MATKAYQPRHPNQHLKATHLCPAGTRRRIPWVTSVLRRSFIAICRGNPGGKSFAGGWGREFRQVGQMRVSACFFFGGGCRCWKRMQIKGGESVFSWCVLFLLLDSRCFFEFEDVWVKMWSGGHIGCDVKIAAGMVFGSLMFSKLRGVLHWKLHCKWNVSFKVSWIFCHNIKKDV